MYKRIEFVAQKEERKEFLWSRQLRCLQCVLCFFLDLLSKLNIEELLFKENYFVSRIVFTHFIFSPKSIVCSFQFQSMHSAKSRLPT